MIKIIYLLLLIPFLIGAQTIEEKNIWQPFEFFIGSWKGDETGKAGMGKGERTYKYIMNKRYIYCENISRFEPQEKNPKGEVHEDRTIFSYDKYREVFVVRQFNSEGYVNKFVLDSLSTDKRTYIFVSENCENSPEGLRARLTYKISNRNEFTELFELAMPGKDFSIWLRNFWRRDNI